MRPEIIAIETLETVRDQADAQLTILIEQCGIAEGLDQREDWPLQTDERRLDLLRAHYQATTPVPVAPPTDAHWSELLDREHAEELRADAARTLEEAGIRPDGAVMRDMEDRFGEVEDNG